MERRNEWTGQKKEWKPAVSTFVNFPQRNWGDAEVSNSVAVRLSPQPSPAATGLQVPPATIKFGGELRRWVAESYWKILPGMFNVYSAMYLLSKRKLYIQYKHNDPTIPKSMRNRPGAIYEYSDVTPVEALAFIRSSDYDEWLRKNITSEFPDQLPKKTCRLVTDDNGYVPRKKVWHSGGAVWLVPRNVAGYSFREVKKRKVFRKGSK